MVLNILTQYPLRPFQATSIAPAASKFVIGHQWNQIKVREPLVTVPLSYHALRPLVTMPLSCHAP